MNKVILWIEDYLKATRSFLMIKSLGFEEKLAVFFTLFYNRLLLVVTMAVSMGHVYCDYES